MRRRIAMIGNASGPFGSFAQGGVYAAPGDLPLAMAEAFVAAGAARWLAEPAAAPAVAVEVAVAPEVEVAAPAPASKKRGRPRKDGR